MSLFKCLVPVLVLLLVEGSSARPAGANAKDNHYPPTGQQPAVIVQGGASLVQGNGRVISIGTYNGGSSGTIETPCSGGCSMGKGNAAANAEATATANSETTSGLTGKIEAQNPLHVEGPQATGVNGNSQGNGHPDGETTAATAVSQSRVNHFLNQLGQWHFFPFEVVNAGGGAGPSTFGGYGPASGSRVPGANSASNAVANAGSSGVGGSSVGNGNAAANAEATATANSVTTSGLTGKIEAQNPLHVEGPQAPGVNGNGQGNGHPDGETTAATRTNSANNAVASAGSSGVGGYSMGNGNAAANAEATATANSETTSGTTGKMEPQNPLHVEGPQAPGVNGNGQGNGHPDGETTAAIAVSQSRVNPFLSQPGQWIFVPSEAANAGGGAGPSTFGGYGPAYGSRILGTNSASNAFANAGSRGVGGSSVGNGNAAANAEATATANSETTSGTTGKMEPQNPLHVEGPQAPGVNGNGQGNGHPDGETTAAIAVSQSRVNPFLSQPGQWIFVPSEAANAGGGAGPSTFGGYGPAYGSRILGTNSASNAFANAGSRGVGGSSVGNGNAAANAEATATANSETTSGSTADAVSNTNRQGSSGGLSRAISIANSNASGGSTSSSSKSTANGSGVKSSAFSYASASAGANV